MDVFEKIGSLNLPAESFVVVGGSALECYGIRKSDDIDLCIMPDLYTDLKNSGCEIETKPNGSQIIHPQPKNNFELGLSWSYGNYQATFQELVDRSNLIHGVHVASLEDIIAYKKELGREKDIEDIKLINNYLTNKQK